MSNPIKNKFDAVQNVYNFYKLDVRLLPAQSEKMTKDMADNLFQKSKLLVLSFQRKDSRLVVANASSLDPWSNPLKVGWLDGRTIRMKKWPAVQIPLVKHEFLQSG